MIRSFNGKGPKIADSAFVSEVAYVMGDVELCEDCGVLPGAVIRADFGSVKIGRNTDIEDNSVIHAGDPGMEIGENVIIGHNAIVEGRRIGNNTLIGNNATVLHMAEIGDYCVIAAGSVVTEGVKIPSRSFVVGVPGKVKGEVTDKQLQWMQIHFKFYGELKKRFKEQGL